MPGKLTRLIFPPMSDKKRALSKPFFCRGIYLYIHTFFKQLLYLNPTIMLYALSFTLALIGLIAWLANARHASRHYARAFYIALALYFISWLSADATLGYKLMALSRDLLVMGGTAFLASLFLNQKRFFYFFAFLIALLFARFYWGKMIQTFPEKPADTLHAPEVPPPLSFNKDYELLVELKPGVRLEDFQKLLRGLGISDFEPAFFMRDEALTDLDDFFAVNIPEKLENQVDRILSDLEKSPLVDYVEGNENIMIEPMRPVPLPRINRKFGINDPDLEKLWGFEAMEVDQLYNLLKTNKIKPKKKARIAILDTGVDAAHEDLAARYRSVNAAYDVDVVGHGTHCAGIAAAVTNNGIGVASFAPTNDFVEVSSIKVLNDFGGGTQRTVINGILEAADLGVDVISMSLGGRSNSSRLKAYKQAIRYANKKGAIVVVAAGNSNANARGFSPANTPGVITVSAVDTLLKKAGFSNYISDLDMGIAAPGVAIYSTTPTHSRVGKYAAFNGTSMATPYVAGLIGLMRSLRPDLTTAEAYDLLRSTGRKTGDTAKTGRLIMPAAAIRKLLE